MDLARTALTRGRIIAAFVVAAAADLIQLPLTFAFFGALGSIVGIPAGAPFEAVDLAVDIVAAIATTYLLGFHWALLPTSFLEVIPGLDIAPTWTGCVAYVVWRRRQEGAIARDDGTDHVLARRDGRPR